MRLISDTLMNLRICVLLFLVLIFSLVSLSSSDNSYEENGNLFERAVRTESRFDRRRQLTLIPEPYGPFYGFVYGTRTAARLPIQASATGVCQKGRRYRIRRTEDLRRLESELQCIFSSGLTPSKVPEGAQFGSVLLTLNSRHFLINPFVSFLWKGNFVFKAECQNGNSTPTFIGFHNVRGRSLLPFSLTIDHLKANFAPGEYEDGRKSVVMDFSQDFSRTCPDYADFVERNKSSLPTRAKTLANVYPFTQALDVFRLVGRQEDGGAIYLGKTYLRDYYRRDKQIATIAFWYIVSYDEGVNPEFQAGQELSPLEADFKYTFPGVVDIVLRYLPIDNAISRPLGTLWKFNRGVWRTGRASYLNFREFLRQLGSLQANVRRLRNYFASQRPKNDYT